LTIITYRDQPALNTPMTIEELATSPGHGLARYFPYKEEAGGSSPSTPTTESLATAGLSSFPEL
jgi:hypothetical protein